MKKLFIILISSEFIILSSFTILKLCQYRNYNYILNDKKVLEKQNSRIDKLDKQINEYNEQISNHNNEEVELWKKSLEEIQKNL